MHGDFQQMTFFFALFAVGTLYASQFFSHLGSRAKAGNLLLLPASTFEKFLCGWLYTVLLFFLVFTAAFYLADVLMVGIANAFSQADAPTRKATLYNVFKLRLIRFNNNWTIYLVFFFFSIQSIFLIGSVHFKKYSFIKTIITGFVAYLILFSLVFFLYRQFVPGGERVDGPVTISEWIPQVVWFLVHVIAPVSWMVTYYRLKQKQV
jgi:hypothetical protein